MTLFVELLQVALGNREALSRNSSAQEWLEMMEESQRQAVTGVMLDGLERLPEDQRPSQMILLQWIGQEQLIEQTSRLHQIRAKDLTMMLAAEGRPSCILKGLSSAARYPHPDRRQGGDIDIWVKGDRKYVTQYLKGHHALERVIYHHADVKIFEDVDTEVHFHPSWLYNPFHNARLQRWFDKQHDVQIAQRPDESGYVTTTAEFDVVYQLVHMFHHLMEEGVGVRHVVDYYYVLKQLNIERDTLYHGQTYQFVLKELVHVIDSFGLRIFLAAMMYVMREMCGATSALLICDPDEKEGRFLMEQIMLAGNFGHQRKGEQMHRNSKRFYTTMVKHYPNEVLWMVPWKVWHWCWRKVNGYYDNRRLDK